MADPTEPPADRGPAATGGRVSRPYRTLVLLVLGCLCVGLLAAGVGAALSLLVEGAARPVVWGLGTALVAVGAGVGWESREAKGAAGKSQ